MNRRKTILFVSAYLSLITAAENELGAAGYGVRCAHNISSAVRCLTSDSIDAVVLCGSLDTGVRRTISDHVKLRLRVPVVLLSPAKPNSIEELLRVLESTGEEDWRKAA